MRTVILILLPSLAICGFLVDGFIPSLIDGKREPRRANGYRENCHACTSKYVLTKKATVPVILAKPGDQDDKLGKLGYSSQEIQSSAKAPGEEESVNVNVVEDIDAITLTAIGFGLIAINFFVLANAGDGGLGGIVASIINLSRQ